MNWDAIGAVGEIMGALAVLVTLVYLARQVHQNTFQARLGSIQAINASNDSAFDPIYIPENSIIFTRGQQSYVDLTEHEKIVFDMLMTRLIASFDATTYQYIHGSYEEELFWGTARFYNGFIASAGGGEWYATHKETFSANCRKALENPVKNQET